MVEKVGDPAGGPPVPARPVEGCTSFYHLWQGPPVGEPGEPDAYQSCLCGKLIWKQRSNATFSGYKTIHAARPGEEPPDATRMGRKDASAEGEGAMSKMRHAAGNRHRTVRGDGALLSDVPEEGQAAADRTTEGVGARPDAAPALLDLPDGALKFVKCEIERLASEIPFHRRAQLVAVDQGIDPALLALQSLAQQLAVAQAERDKWREEAETYGIGFGRTADESASEHVAAIKRIVATAEADRAALAARVQALAQRFDQTQGVILQTQGVILPTLNNEVFRAAWVREEVRALTATIKGG